MRARAEAVEATRDRIARAAMARFLAQLYDVVTIAAVAADAGVSTSPATTSGAGRTTPPPRSPR